MHKTSKYSEMLWYVDIWWYVKQKNWKFAFVDKDNQLIKRPTDQRMLLCTFLFSRIWSCVNFSLIHVIYPVIYTVAVFSYPTFFQLIFQCHWIRQNGKCLVLKSDQIAFVANLFQLEISSNLANTPCSQEILKCRRLKSEVMATFFRHWHLVRVIKAETGFVVQWQLLKIAVSPDVPLLAILMQF